MTRPPPGDSDLVVRSLQGDDQAFAELTQRHEGMVRAIIRRHASRAREEVDDLTQQAFVTAFRKLENLSDPSRFHAWLWGITSRVCWKWTARRSTRGEASALDVEHAAAPDSRDDAMRRELRERIAAALVDLAPEYQDVLLLRFVDGLDQEEIAEITGRTPGSVRGILARGTRLLRDQLVSTWNELNPGMTLSTGDALPEEVEQILGADEKSVLVIGPDYEVVAVNAPWSDHTGFHRDQAIGTKCYALSHGRDTPCSGADHPCPVELIGDGSRQASVVHHHKTATGEQEVQVVTMPVDQNLTSGRKRRYYIESIEPRRREQ